MRISPEVQVLHISSDPQKLPGLQREWESLVVAPCEAAGLKTPQFVVVSSPYRRLFHPLLEYVHDLQIQNPDRIIAVTLPELVEARWYQYPLHNQRATWLKAALLWRGDHRVVVINVPWYMGKEESQLVKLPTVTG